MDAPAALNGDGKLESPVTVPFRMTPNLQHFLTPHGIYVRVQSQPRVLGIECPETRFGPNSEAGIWHRLTALTLRES